MIYAIELDYDEFMLLEDKVRFDIKVQRYFRDEAKNITWQEKQEAAEKLKLFESILAKMDNAFRLKQRGR
jgi:hypothetical protein